MKDTETAPKTRIWRCPQCKASCRFDETNPFRPFCSERCRTADTANWATENYRIAGKPVDPEQELNKLNASGPDDSERDS
jgi:endogenous inhibitor of DNA gyrase (YacG/DUF329 family)